MKILKWNLITLLVMLFFPNYIFSNQILINKNSLFDSTLNILSKNHNQPGIRDDILVDNIIMLAFYTPDSIIPLEKKIDLILLTNKFEVYTYRVLCNKISKKILTDTTFIHSNKLLLILFCDCEFTLNSFVNNLQTEDSIVFKNNLLYLPQVYELFYNTLIQRVLKKINKTQEKHTSINYFDLLNSMENYYRRKYPLFW